jgi:hypothetical protein
VIILGVALLNGIYGEFDLVVMGVSDRDVGE